MKKAPEVKKNGYVIWYQHIKKLTKIEQTKILHQTALNVNEILKRFDRKISCQEAGDLLLLESVLKQENNLRIYKRIICGATIEKVVFEFGLKLVYQFLILNRFSHELRQNKERELRSFLFDFQSCLVKFEDEKKMANRRIGKRALDKLKKIEKLYQQGEISFPERKKFVVQILEFQLQYLEL